MTRAKCSARNVLLLFILLKYLHSVIQFRYTCPWNWVVVGIETFKVWDANLILVFSRFFIAIHFWWKPKFHTSTVDEWWAYIIVMVYETCSDSLQTLGIRGFNRREGIHGICIVHRIWTVRDFQWWLQAFELTWPVSSAELRILNTGIYLI